MDISPDPSSFGDQGDPRAYEAKWFPCFVLGEFRKYVRDHRSEFLQLIPAKPETGWDPASGIRSVDRAFELGREFLPAATSREL